MVRTRGIGLLVATLLVSALAGCGSAARTARHPEPVHVTLSEVVARATERAVGPGGGNVAAVGSDGTRYDLVVPRGALSAPIAIRMTPVRALAGLPGGTRLAFAVDLAPHGLMFRKAAWLRVEPATPVKVSAGLAVDDADRASLQPIGRDARGYVVPVAHFSGTGGVGLPGGFGQWSGRQPVNPIAGALQNDAINAGGPVNVPPTLEPVGGPSGSGGNGSATTSSSGSFGSDSSLADGIGGAPATGDPSLAGDIADYVQQQAEDQLTGTDDSSRADSERAGLVRRIERVIDDLAAQCVHGKDPSKIADIITWEARGQLLGIDDDPAEAARQDAILHACARFELVVTGKLFFDLGPVFHVGDAIAATVPLELDGVQHTGRAEAPIQPTGYDRGGELIDVFAQGVGMAAGINVPNDYTHNNYVHCTTDAGTIGLDATATKMYKPDGPVVALMFSTARQSSVTCDGGVGTFQVPPFVTMTDVLRGIGVTEATDSGFLLKDFQRSGGANPYAKREIHKDMTMGGAKISADWTFTVNFAPGPLPPPRRQPPVGR